MMEAETAPVRLGFLLLDFPNPPRRQLVKISEIQAECGDSAGSRINIDSEYAAGIAWAG
jgi:hypothetical protein